jgi:hypothetical protein
MEGLKHQRETTASRNLPLGLRLAEPPSNTNISINGWKNQQGARLHENGQDT